MTTQEIQAAWQASYEKHLARFKAQAAEKDQCLNRMHRVSIEGTVALLLQRKASETEQIIEQATEAADAEIRLLTRPARWL